MLFIRSSRTGAIARRGARCKLRQQQSSAGFRFVCPFSLALFTYQVRADFAVTFHGCLNFELELSSLSPSHKRADPSNGCAQWVGSMNETTRPSHTSPFLSLFPHSTHRNRHPHIYVPLSALHHIVCVF